MEAFIGSDRVMRNIRFKKRQVTFAYALSFILFVAMVLPAKADAFDFQLFLKRCGWGTVAGAGLGLISLGLEDHPYDHWSNVAKGASLGLYGGIIYGLTTPSEGVQSRDFVFLQSNAKAKSTELVYVFRF